MPNPPKHYRDMVKLAQMEVELAMDTAIHRYGVSADGHIVWHCLKPWLRGRDLEEMRVGIQTILIPECALRPEWAYIVPELQLFLQITAFGPIGYLNTCTLCHRGV